MDFVFELGCEDLPAKQIGMAMESLGSGFEKRCAESRIGHGEVRVYGSPRRLALCVESVEDYQSDLEQLRVGPAKSAAYDASGALTGAAKGFLKSAGVEESAIRVIKQEKKKGVEVEYIAVKVVEKGKESRLLLGSLMEEILSSIHWAKAMRWGYEERSFARPVHWLLCRLGGEVVEMKFCGVKSGGVSYGHRFMHPGAVEIIHACEYLEKLRSANVLVDPVERRAKVIEETHRVASSVHGHLVKNEGLLDEVVQIVEWPVGIVGRFDESFLSLPRVVLETSLSVHQRYFSVVDEQNQLLPYFVTVSNTEVADSSVISHGNERVLRARLKDGEFFMVEDLKVGLGALSENLYKIRYVEGLGSLSQKVERIVVLSACLAELWEGVEVNQRSVLRCADLCKADLCSAMVGEFPELQGTMGAIYARAMGESEDVCTGIEEHYWPKNAGGLVASSVVGAIVGIADKLDTIVALFALGRVPTGAADPLGLRRSAVGLLRTLLEHEQHLGLDTLVDKAIDGVYRTRSQMDNAGSLNALKDRRELSSSVLEFLLTRLRYMLIESHAAEVVDSVVTGSGLRDVPRIVGRIEALTAMRGESEFEMLIGTFKRVSNIVHQYIEQVNFVVNPELFEHEEEHALYAKVQEVSGGYDRLMLSNHFVEALKVLAELRGCVDDFFDAVLVNCEDKSVRENRYALLGEVEEMFERFSDVRRL